MINLTICIPTLPERFEQLKSLLDLINSQREGLGLSDSVEVLVDDTDRSMSIGLKRDQMYKKAKGVYTVQIDDDDRVADNYVECVYLATLTGADCIGYKEDVRIAGRREASEHSIKYDKWESLPKPIGGIKHRRTPFCKTPIKTDICTRVGVQDMRFREDHDFAERIRPHLYSEAYINEFMYIYNAPTLKNRNDFNRRYGNGN